MQLPKAIRFLVLKVSRARRVKCDEGKPECIRCQSSDRNCEGYPSNAPTAPSASTYTSKSSRDPLEIEALLGGPTVTFQLSPWPDVASERVRLIQLGLHVLAWDPRGVRTFPDTAFWSRLLPQLSQAEPLVGSAVAAFGATYESRFLRKGNIEGELFAANYYNRTLRTLSQHLQTQPHGTLPVMLTCTVLGAMEAMRRRQADALTHAEGAFGLLTYFNLGNQHSTNINSTTLTDGLLAPKQDDTLLYSICYTLDLVISSYAQNRTPVLPVISPAFSDVGFSSAQRTSTVLTSLHSCRNFISNASRFRYRAQTAHLSKLAIEQELHVANLLSLLEALREQQTLGLTPPSHREMLRSTSTLEALCLATLIHATAIFIPHETAYDNYINEFQRIVNCAATALSHEEQAKSDLTPVSPAVGIIMPLCFTAARCRHPAIRRTAIALLQIAGVEGPWHGRTEAAIATKIMQVEERRQGAGSDLDPSFSRQPSEIPERDRVCHHTVLDETYDESTCIHHIKVQFTQCLDVEQMVACDAGFPGSHFWKNLQQDLEVW